MRFRIGSLRRPFVFLLAIAFVATCGAAFAARSTGITILDDKFQVVHVLNGRKAVNAFNAHWSNKKKTSARGVVPQWRYKIDFPDGSRWLYDPAGYTELVSKKTVLYRIQSAGKFNKLIGVTKQPPR